MKTIQQKLLALVLLALAIIVVGVLGAGTAYVWWFAPELKHVGEQLAAVRGDLKTERDDHKKTRDLLAGQNEAVALLRRQGEADRLAAEKAQQLAKGQSLKLQQKAQQILASSPSMANRCAAASVDFDTELKLERGL